MPITTADEAKQLIKNQLDSIGDQLVRSTLEGFLIEPFIQQRHWGGEMYPCWVVAEHPESDTSYIYCFGLPLSWGIVSTSGLEMGMDSNWFRTLEDAFYDSFAAARLRIWRVVRRNSLDTDRVIASSLTLDEADNMIRKLYAQQTTDSNHQLLYGAEPQTRVLW